MSSVVINEEEMLHAIVQYQLHGAPSFYKSADGMLVRRRINSKDSLAARKYLRIIIPKIDTEEQEYFITSAMFPDNIGPNYLVEVTEDDKYNLVWAKRSVHGAYERFVVDREPAPANELTVVLMRAENEEKDEHGTLCPVYIVIATWIGPPTPPKSRIINQLPISEEEKQQLRCESRRWWRNHAFILPKDPKKIVQSSITRKRPSEKEKPDNILN